MEPGFGWLEELSTIQSIQPWLGDKRGELREARQECQRGGRAVRALEGRGCKVMTAGIVGPE